MELYLLMRGLAETNSEAIRWKLVFGESIRENGKIWYECNENKKKIGGGKDGSKQSD